MEKYNIPTAKSTIFSDYDSAIKYLNSTSDGSLVVKADGLASGKGVYIPESKESFSGWWKYSLKFMIIFTFVLRNSKRKNLKKWLIIIRMIIMLGSKLPVNAGQSENIL